MSTYSSYRLLHSLTLLARLKVITVLFCETKFHRAPRNGWNRRYPAVRTRPGKGQRPPTTDGPPTHVEWPLRVPTPAVARFVGDSRSWCIRRWGRLVPMFLSD